MAVLVLTSSNVCFCTIWENPNRRNKIKMQYFVGFVSPDSAKADSGCGEKLDSYLIASYADIFLSKILKYNNSSSSFNRKCPECFLDTV